MASYADQEGALDIAPEAGSLADGSEQGLPEYAIEAHQLRKVYKASGGQPAKEALKGIDLKIKRGSIFGLLGPNGAGKSTFINILAGLVNKTSGSASIWGFDTTLNPRQARGAIGVVPQELNVDPFFTPAEAMELQAGLYGVRKADRHTMEILEALGLADKADAYARTLSGGMRRRLLVAKALVHTPPVLILDEPTAGVDIELRRQLWDYVKELNKRGTTIVLTTHYLEEAQSLCDEIAIVNHGEVVCCEPTEQLLSRIHEKRVIVRGEEPILEVPESLRMLKSEITEDGQLSVMFNPTETKLADVLARINVAGIVIADLSTQEADLEDVFLKLTSG